MPVPTVKTRFSARNKANEEKNDEQQHQQQQSQQQQRPLPSSSIARPTLLGPGAPGQPPAPQLPSIAADSDSLFPARPRRLWKVSDTRLNALPAGYPPVDPRCSIYVADAPPSVVAVRIAEALRRLSVAVEYDEETPCATCWTADRCHFVVQLWQGPKSPGAVRRSGVPDLSAGILVEGMRLSGSVITFHRMLQTVLAAAISHDTGDDRRTYYQSNTLEYPRWTTTSESDDLEMASEDVDQRNRDGVSMALEALEEAAALLDKDRHDAQNLGMERLVHLTDVHTVGVTVATVAAQSLLGVPPIDDAAAVLTSVHKEWMVGLLMERRLPNEKDLSNTEEDYSTPSNAEKATATAARPSRFACSPKQGQKMVQQNNNDGADTTTAVNDDDNESVRVEALLKQMREERALTGDANHAGRLRGLLMRVWANSLQVLHTHDGVALTTLLQHQKHLTTREFLNALLEDAEGCSRPPLAAVMGTRLASPHESVWALVCLRILSQHSVTARRHLERTTYAGVLEKAILVGSALHGILRQEANLAMTAWSEKR